MGAFPTGPRGAGSALYFYAPDAVSELFASATHVRIEAFGLPDVRLMAKLYRGAWTDSDLARLVELVDGQPYLCRMIVRPSTGAPKPELLDVDRLKIEHCATVLRQVWLRVAEQPDLRKPLCLLLRDPTTKLTTDEYHRLYQAGLVRRVEGVYCVPNQLVASYFKKSVYLPFSRAPAAARARESAIGVTPSPEFLGAPHVDLPAGGHFAASPWRPSPSALCYAGSMDPDEGPLQMERENTDESLRNERTKSDEELGARLRVIEEGTADAVDNALEGRRRRDRGLPHDGRSACRELGGPRAREQHRAEGARGGGRADGARAGGGGRGAPRQAGGRHHDAAATLAHGAREERISTS